MPPLARNYSRITGVRDPSLLVVAAEGYATEYSYFIGISKEITDSRIKLIPLRRENSGESCPVQVVQEIDRYRRSHSLQSSDEYCVVVDADRKSPQKLSEAAALCDQKEYLLAATNPCFELWLMLHYVDLGELTEQDWNEIRTDCKKRCCELIRDKIGEFSAVKVDIDLFWPYSERAITNAKQLDTDKFLRWPEFPGSRVYLIIEKIHKKLY